MSSADTRVGYENVEYLFFLLVDDPGSTASPKSVAEESVRIVLQRRHQAAAGERSAKSVGYNLFSVKPDGTRKRAPVTGPGDQQYGSWSPDGGWLVYADNVGGDWEIVKQTVAGSSYTALTDNAVTDWEADWQPA